MRYNNIKKFVMASTSSIYAGSKMPYRESSAVNQPISPYAASKKAAELIAYTYSHQFDLDVTIVRYFTVYGPAGRPEMSIIRFIKWIDEEKPIILYGDGTQSRDFTYIDDIAKGTIAAAKSLCKYEIINQKPFHSADITTTLADITKAKNILDWSPKTSLDEGLLQTVKWYKENKPWLSKVKFI